MIIVGSLFYEFPYNNDFLHTKMILVICFKNDIGFTDTPIEYITTRNVAGRPFMDSLNDYKLAETTPLHGYIKANICKTVVEICSLVVR